MTGSYGGGLTHIRLRAQARTALQAVCEPEPRPA